MFNIGNFKQMSIPNQSLFAEIKSDIANILEEIEKIPVYSDRYVASVRVDNSEKDIENLCKDITAKAKVLKNKLDVLGQKIVPIEKLIYEHSVNKFRQTMDKYFTEVGKFRKIVRDKSRRSLKIIDPKLTDEQIDNAIDENQVQKIIQASLIDEKLDDTVREIEERHIRIVKLTETIEDIQQLFNDLAFLIDVQQEKLNVVEHRINMTKDITENANKSLTTAEDYQKKSRKCICYIVVGLAVIIVLSVTLTQI